MPLLFAIKKSQGFLCICPYDVEAKASWPLPGYGPESYDLNLSLSLHLFSYFRFDSYDYIYSAM